MSYPLRLPNVNVVQSQQASSLTRKLPFILLGFAAIVIIFSSFLVFNPQPMMSGMMPGSMSSMMSESMVSMPLLWPSVLTISSVAVLIGLAYLIAFPTIKFSDSDANVAQNHISAEAPDPLSILIRVSKPEERAVLEVLRGSGGICRQKDIVLKTGLSKIKVHRIIARLAERGAVQVKKTGKTNEITVPSWLMQSQPESHTL